MAHDETEALRRLQVAAINFAPGSREALEGEYGQVWDTDQVREAFEVLSFLAPYVVVRDRKTGTKGTLMFQHHPRFYFAWTAEDHG